MTHAVRMDDLRVTNFLHSAILDWTASELARADPAIAFPRLEVFCAADDGAAEASASARRDDCRSEGDRRAIDLCCTQSCADAWCMGSAFACDRAVRHAKPDASATCVDWPIGVVAEPPAIITHRRLLRSLTVSIRTAQREHPHVALRSARTDRFGRASPTTIRSSPRQRSTLPTTRRDQHGSAWADLRACPLHTDVRPAWLRAPRHNVMRLTSTSGCIAYASACPVVGLCVDGSRAMSADAAD